MKKRAELDYYYVLKSGRELSAFGWTLGIDEEGTISEGSGSDGELETADHAELFKMGVVTDPVPLTAEERREIAEEMVARWRRWGRL